MGRYSGNHVNKLPQRSISMNNFRGAGSTNICLFSTVDRRSWPMTKLKDICRLKLSSRDSISSSLGKIQKLKNITSEYFIYLMGRIQLTMLPNGGLVSQTFSWKIKDYCMQLSHMWTQCLNNQQPTNNN